MMTYVSIQRMLPSFHQSCSEMIKEWESGCQIRVHHVRLDVWPSLQILTADVISRTAFGSSYQEGRKVFVLLREQGVLILNNMQCGYNYYSRMEVKVQSYN